MPRGEDTSRDPKRKVDRMRNFGYMAMNQHRAIGPNGKLRNAMIPKVLHRFIHPTLPLHMTAWHGNLTEDSLRKIPQTYPPGEIEPGLDDEGTPSLFRLTPPLTQPPV